MQGKGEGEAMQTTHEKSVTHNAVRIMSALAIAAWLGVGCGKTETPEPPPEAPSAVEEEKWEPETVTPPTAPGDHGHDGHDHGPGGHTH